jgi:hypothetical protein
MPSHRRVEFKKGAIKSILSRLGDEMFTMLKQSLAQDYQIDLDWDDAYTLEELQIALQRIVGFNGANLLMAEIHREIEVLMAQNVQE